MANDEASFGLFSDISISNGIMDRIGDDAEIIRTIS